MLTIDAPPATDASASPTSKRSASAMLDETPPSRAPLRLSLVSEQPILPPPKSVPPVAAAAPVAAPEVAPPEEEIEPVPLSSSALVEAPPSSRGVVEISSDELVDAPPSARDAVQAAREAVAKKAPHIELADDDDGDGGEDGADAENVSLADVQVVAKIPTPLPPKAGTLKTLPPSVLSAPPPTIEVSPASGPAKKEPEAAKVEAKTSDDTKKSPSVPPPKKDSAPPKKTEAAPAKKKGTEPAAAKSATAKAAKAEAESQRPPTEEREGRSSFVWIAGAAGVALVAWLATRGSGTTATSMPPTAEPSTTTASPVTSTISGVTAAPVVSAAVTPSASGSARVVDVPATELVSGAASGKPAGEPGTSGRSTSDLLERAAKARHAGDLAKASALYGRVLEMHPGDVEASSGLGELARMNGDLPGAKRHFQEALQAAPSFSPALLGLGDTLWELGEKHEASQVYARLVGARADVPERARERSQTGGAAPKAVPTVAPLPASALPPSPPAPEEGAN